MTLISLNDKALRPGVAVGSGLGDGLGSALGLGEGLGVGVLLGLDEGWGDRLGSGVAVTVALGEATGLGLGVLLGIGLGVPVPGTGWQPQSPSKRIPALCLALNLTLFTPCLLGISSSLIASRNVRLNRIALSDFDAMYPAKVPDSRI
ncbi:MAG: hypothetical protein CVV27_02120 [Candidatus Melainabacteria bacterium HGW-Melainabacteria-1]|nr:MAG: hypothetical protein CVV27_02120 [Candidatus Melainabacteria bacterium HGW-Melainabacteria-1]